MTDIRNKQNKFEAKRKNIIDAVVKEHNKGMKKMNLPEAESRTGIEVDFTSELLKKRAELAATPPKSNGIGF